LASLEAVPLTDWPQHEPAEIAHIEDEPDVIFKQILAVGLLPGATVRVFENRPDCVVLSDGEHEHHLAPVVAANIHVKARRQAPRMAADVLRLSDLKDGQDSEVVAIDPQYRGFGRRRLMDLGLTPHARVQAHLTNAFGDPRAYLVRGTMIALRKDQAALIWVRPNPMPVQKTGVVTA
jgi:DtxR family Mn-dependent transcriptional regulator